MFKSLLDHSETEGMAIGMGQQRRMCERVYGGGLQIDWNLADAKVGRFWRATPRTRTALLVDVSVGGARVLADADPSITPGRNVVIGANGALGLVKIRWTRPQEGTRTMMCGVYFLDLDIRLADLLATPISEGRAPVAWDHTAVYG